MLNDSYFNLQIKTEERINSTLPAFLTDVYDGSFLETENGWELGLEDSERLEPVLRKLQSLQEQYDIEYKLKYKPVENWNEKWEKSIQPITIDSWLQICTEMNQARDDFQHTLIVKPQNAFGTGHHSTTFSIIRLMKDIDFKSKNVLDLGCGTGILGILALRMGAENVEFIDNDRKSIKNTVENLQKNFIFDSYSLVPGTIEQAERKQYDIILANIYRNVLIENKEKLFSLGKHLLLSGYRENAIKEIETTFMSDNCERVAFESQGEWCAHHFKRTS